MKKTFRRDIRFARARAIGNTGTRALITRQLRRPKMNSAPRQALTYRWIKCPQTGRLECRWSREPATAADGGERRRILPARPAARRRAVLRRAA